MKLSVFLVLLSLFQVNAATYAQKITYNKNKVTLSQLFNEIRKQTGYDVVWSERKIEGISARNFYFLEASVSKVLNEALEGLPLTYEIRDKMILIKDKPDAPVLSRPVEGEQDSYDVTGTVLDMDGKPVAGATILVKGTRLGVLTDKAGNFKIRVPKENELIMISHIGYKYKEVNVKGKTNIQLYLEAGESQLDDVVLIGYGKQQKRDVVTAVSTLSSEEIMQENQVNLANALQGKVNGAVIVSGSGTPGKNRPTIMIRGNNPKNPPLIVVDGVPRYQDLGTYPSGGISLTGLTLDDINPDEVESISVLKDNAATAIYGTRGAHGVILVNTKRGKIGKPSFSLYSNFSYDEPGRFPKVFEAYKYALVQNEYNVNSGMKPAYSDEVLEKIKNNSDPTVYPNTNFYDALVQRNALQHTNSLSVSGGTEGVSYYVNGSATTQKGIVKAFDHNRYTLQSNTDIRITKDMKLAMNMGYRTTNTDGAFIQTGDAIFSAILITPPLTPIYNKDGSLYATNDYGNKWANTQPDLSGYQTNRSNNISVQANFEYNIPFVKGLTFRVNNSVNYNSADYKSFQKYYDTYVPDEKSATGYRKTGGFTPNNLRQNIGNASFFNTDIGFDYSKKIGVHRLGIMLMGTNYYGKSMSLQAYRDGIIGDLETINSGRTLNQSNGGVETEQGKMGGIARVNYDYNGKYLFEYAMRADASDNFPKKNRWGFFSGGALSWRLSEEEFIKDNLTFVQDLKIRTSIGLTGVDNLSPFNYYYTYNIATSGLNAGGGYAFGGVYQPSFVLNTSNIPNRDVTWGRSVMRNVGLDFSLWKGMLSGTFDIYDKKLSNLPRAKDLAIPATFGIGAPMFNFARENYSGYEISLTNNTHFNEKMSLTSTFNLTYSKSRVIDYGEPVNTAPYLKKEGYSIQSSRFYRALGIFQTQEEIDAYAVVQDGNKNSTLRPGDIKFADLNGDGIIDVNDQEVYNDTNIPPYAGGLNLTFRYGGLSLNAFFQGSAGNRIHFVPGTYTDYGYENSWRPDNTDARYPRISNSTNNAPRQRPNTLYMQKGDYLRFKNLKLAYAIPSQWLRGTGLANVSISAAVLNLWAISGIKDIDPEVAPTSNINDGGYYPLQRNYSLGINVGL
ncbi:SusC/RagA family TonB-linked outer membrane protein [Sphingobacterium yanglingense]|nr:TonB-dependent receptor [Sphingobacterium yanglingense]